MEQKVRDFEKYGFDTASDNKGNLESFKLFLERVFHGYIYDPDKEFVLPENVKKSYESKIYRIKEKIESYNNQIQHYKKLQEEHREKKEQIREQNKELRVSGNEYSPGTYYLKLTATTILSLFVFLFYGWMMIHINNPSDFFAIIPPVSKIFSSVSENWLTLFWGFVPLFLCYALEWMFEPNVSKKRRYFIPVLILIILALDYIIAYSMHQKHNEVNTLLGLPILTFSEDINFWLVLIIGPVAAFLLTFLIYLTKNSSPKEKKRTISLIEDLEKEEEKHRQKEMAFKEDWKKIEKERESYEEQIRDLELRINHTYIPKNILLMRLNEFYSGWVKWLRSSKSNIEESEFNVILAPYREEYNKILNRVNNTFTEDIEHL